MIKKNSRMQAQPYLDSCNNPYQCSIRTAELPVGVPVPNLETAVNLRPPDSLESELGRATWPLGLEGAITRTCAPASYSLGLGTLPVRPPSVYKVAGAPLAQFPGALRRDQARGTQNLGWGVGGRVNCRIAKFGNCLQRSRSPDPATFSCPCLPGPSARRGCLCIGCLCIENVCK